MIENYKSKIEQLEKFGRNLYLKKIASNFVIISVTDLNIKYGVSLPDSKRNPGDIPLLASNGISDYISEYNAYNAIVLGCRGTLGNVFYQKDNCFVLNTAFYINNPTNYGNLFFALRYEKGLTLYSSGAAQPQITLDAIKNVSLKLPVDNNLNKILDLISNYASLINKLKDIKSILLNKYFN